MTGQMTEAQAEALLTPPKTKTVEFIEYYYALATGFMANGIEVDLAAGDVLDEDYTMGYTQLRKGNGRVICIAPGWLWCERYTREIPVKP
jgi:hypothetical protein